MIQVINVGLIPNDGTGDNLRNAMVKVNENFQEVLTLLNGYSPTGHTHTISDIIGLQTALNTITTDITDIEDTLVNYTIISGDVATLQAQITVINQGITSINTIIGQQNASIQAINVVLDEILDQLGELEMDAVEEAPQDGQTYGRKDATWVPIEIEGLDELSAITTTHTAQIASLSGNVSSNASQINALGVTVTGHTSQIAALSAATSGNTSKIITLSGSVSSNTAQIAVLSGDLETKQSRLVLTNNYWIMPVFGSTTRQVLGPDMTIANGATARNYENTNEFTRTPRLGHVNAFARQITGMIPTSSKIDLVCKFGAADSATTTGVRYYIGLVPSNFLGAIDPTVFINSLCFARPDSGTTWHICHNDATGTATLVNTGFPANTESDEIYVGEIDWHPTSGATFTLTRLSTGLSFTYSTSTNIPVNNGTLALGWGGYSAGLDFAGINVNLKHFL